MDVLILAAGYATRLYPLTENLPKPLIEVAGIPLIEHILQRLGKIPLDNIYVVTNSKFYKQFMLWKRTIPLNITIIDDGTLTNEDRLGAIGDIDFTLKKMDITGDLLVIAGDNMFEFSLENMYEEFKIRGASLVALRDFYDTKYIAKRYGAVTLDSTGKVIDFEEKPAEPKSTLASTACYFFTQKDLLLLKKGVREGLNMDNTGDFIHYLVDTSEVYGYPFSEQWFDIGSHDQLQEARQYYSLKELSLSLDIPKIYS